MSLVALSSSATVSPSMARGAMMFSRLSSASKRAPTSTQLRTFSPRPRSLHTSSLYRPRCRTLPTSSARLQQLTRSQFQSSQLRNISQDIHVPKPKPWRRAYDMSLGALALVGVVSLGSIFYFYSGHVVLEKVPLTNRSRLLWADKEYDEELGHPIEGWLMNQREKPRLSEDDAVAKLVRSIMKRLLEVDLAKGLEFKVYIFDDFTEPNAWGGPAQHGGRIFINTGCIQSCKNPEEVAAVLAHEMGHVIARHVIEQSLKKAFAQHIVRYFGFKGTIGTDLITLRVQEAEADHMGLLIMAQAGFDPEKRLSYLKDRLEQETEWLGGREPLPEFLSTHPSSERRIKLAESLMPEASKLFAKRGSIASEITGWDEVKAQLDASYAQYAEQCAINDSLAPDVLLKTINGKLNNLIEVWNNLVDVQRSAVEEALKSKILEEAVKEVVSQKEAMKTETVIVAEVKGMEQEDEGIDVSDVQTGPAIRDSASIALAPPPMVGAPPMEGACGISQPQDDAAALSGENAKTSETERERESSSKE